MVRPSRLAFGAALLIAAGCAGGEPTAPPAPNRMSPEAGALMTESDTTCRSGWGVPNGKC